jgi:hypothetical protein
LYISGIEKHKQKHKKMETKTQNTEKRVWIEWGNKQTIVEQFATVDQFMESGYMEKYASNFGYNHLINKEVDRMHNLDIEHIFITKADPELNYGLDFKMWKVYTIDGGMRFLKEITLGGCSITNAPLARVNLNVKTPVGLDFTDLANVDIELFAEWTKNCENNVFESFEFSTNVWYKKDAEFRPELRRMCKEWKFIFA